MQRDEPVLRQELRFGEPFFCDLAEEFGLVPATRSSTGSPRLPVQAATDTCSSSVASSPRLPLRRGSRRTVVCASIADVPDVSSPLWSHSCLWTELATLATLAPSARDALRQTRAGPADGARRSGLAQAKPR
ncbi:hypothetical protein ACFPN7_29740 [Amycolatopsis halotolerans]|uniref:hypothetical protein n=1 Tax=Amycolatopsis halotolerans TaxID=330083 RepID=UPI00360C88F8